MLLKFRSVETVPGDAPRAPPAAASVAGAADADLLRRCAAGETAALAALYQRHGGAVFRYAWLVTGAEAAAADAVQDTFLALFNRASGFDPARGSAVGYLCGIARHLALRHHDARLEPTAQIEDVAQQREDDGATLPPPAAAERAQSLVRLYAAIRRLPPHYRDVLVLVELQELSYAEAAAVAGIELGTVRSRLSRARDRLRELLLDGDARTLDAGALHDAGPDADPGADSGANPP
jgi:RNA polymerase sigma-70 factor (ECF subfamily)